MTCIRFCGCPQCQVENGVENTQKAYHQQISQNSYTELGTQKANLNTATIHRPFRVRSGVKFGI